MKLRQLGELRVRGLVVNALKRSGKSLLEIGLDDASAVRCEAPAIVVNIDSFVESTDKPPSMKWDDAGRKAVIGALSDLVAKGAKPCYVVVSLCLPAEFEVKDLKLILKGFNTAAEESGCEIVGGDINSSEDAIITVAALGFAEPDNIIPRSGTMPGDLVGVTGEFGWTYLGLKVAMGMIDLPEPYRQMAIDWVNRPRLHLKEGLILSQHKLAVSCIDSSDGLAASLYELSIASKVGFMVERLPISKSLEEAAKISGISVEDAVFYGGEEYNLVFTVKPTAKKLLEEIFGRHGLKVYWIGKAVEDGGVWYRGEKLRYGWEHFRL